MKYRNNNYKHTLHMKESFLVPILLDMPDRIFNNPFFMLGVSYKDTCGLLEIYPEYSWNGLSGLFPWISNTVNTRTPTLVHDCFYQMFRRRLLDIKYRPVVDKLLYDMLIERGMWKPRAKLIYHGVRVGGLSHAVRERVILEAP